MSEKTFDLVVIGAGPAGYVAAIRAAQLGMKVACVEKEDKLGGTCLRVGCIPSKALLDSSEKYHEVKHALGRHGIKVGGVELDLGAMLGRKDQVVTDLTRGIAGLFKKNKIEHVRGTGRVAGPGRVEVSVAGGKEILGAARILIATGSAPREIPGFAYDGERIGHSTHALAYPEVPGKLLVLGGGAIGLELGSVWNRLGAEVLVVEFMDRIVPTMDREMGDKLQRSLEKQGMKFLLGTRAEGWKPGKGGKPLVKLVTGSETREEACDRVLVAVGRVPFTDGLGLDEAGVKRDERGRIAVDHHYETNVKGIFAIGDVIAGPMLAHKAEEEGIAAVELMAGKAGHVNYKVIPGVVYTHPELASVGLSEEEAAAAGLAVNVGRFPFTANGRAKALGETDGLVKVLADARTDRLLGMHILGPRASDMITEGVTAMEFSASVEDVAMTCHAHPTLPEAVKEAALAALKRAIHA